MRIPSNHCPRTLGRYNENSPILVFFSNLLVCQLGLNLTMPDLGTPVFHFPAASAASSIHTPSRS